MFKNFMKCGIAGWCMEIIFTAFHAYRKRDMTLTGQTSIWMFPIYGMAALLTPIYRVLHKKSVFLRGCVYTVCIFTAEFFSGRFLKRRNLCPWSYRRSRWNIGEVIRLDYIPCWFLAGLFFEKLLSHTPSSK